jgi:hypothetical protein
MTGVVLSKSGPPIFLFRIEMVLRSLSAAVIFSLAWAQGSLLSAPNWKPASAALWWCGSAFPALLAIVIVRPRVVKALTVDESADDSPRCWQTIARLENTLFWKVSFWLRAFLWPLSWGLIVFFTEQTIAFGRWNSLYFQAGFRDFLGALLSTLSLSFFFWHLWSSIVSVIKWVVVGTCEWLEKTPRRSLALAGLYLAEVIFYVPVLALLLAGISRFV